jgi:ankyrin repeat protein
LDEDGITPLARAINQIQVEKEEGSAEKIPKIYRCIQELVTNKVRLNLSDSEGYFPLDLSAKYGLTDLVQQFAELVEISRKFPTKLGRRCASSL